MSSVKSWEASSQEHTKQMQVIGPKYSLDLQQLSGFLLYLMAVSPNLLFALHVDRTPLMKASRPMSLILNSWSVVQSRNLGHSLLSLKQMISAPKILLL